MGSREKRGAYLVKHHAPDVVWQRIPLRHSCDLAVRWCAVTTRGDNRHAVEEFVVMLLQSTKFESQGLGGRVYVAKRARSGFRFWICLNRAVNMMSSAKLTLGD